VVIETKHFTRVSNTGPPFNDDDEDAFGFDTLAAAISHDVGFNVFPVRMSTDDGDASMVDNDDDDETACNLSMVAANVRPVKVSASRLASCCSSLSAAQNNGAPRHRKSLTTATHRQNN